MTNSASVMAFYHTDGLVPTWNHAMKFAGKQGRIATLPEIIDAKINADSDSPEWGTYYTSASAEYLGYSQHTGKKIIIVAHGVGPMSTLQGILKAYSYEFDDKTHRNKGGRITQEEFWKLERGEYGEVNIIDYEKQVSKYEFPFSNSLSVGDSLKDKLILARLGANAELFLHKHKNISDVFHVQNYSALKRESPQILTNTDPNNCSYHNSYTDKIPDLKDNLALAHLLSIGQLYRVGDNQGDRLISDISCHEWSNGCRFVGIQPEADISKGIHSGPDAYKLLRNHWQDLLVEIQPTQIGFRHLTQIRETYFTEYEKKGASMDTGEPEFLVTKIEPVGNLIDFETAIGGYHGFFKYKIIEVARLKPEGTNSYQCLGSPTIVYDKDGNPAFHKVTVQFYKAEIDSSHRLIREKDLAKNLDQMLELMN
jgi:hypothetical protein